MTKDESLALKGIAIIMMLLYHLFYVSKVGYCSLINIGGVSLIRRFSEICYPVPLYVMISGYGLYASKIKGSKSKNDFRRIKSIYAHVWIILLLILPVACFVAPDKYPGNFASFIKNVLCLSSSYNSEYWFILPYIILLLLSNVICKFVEKNNWFVSILFSLILSIVYLFLYKFVGLSRIKDYLGFGIELYFTMSFIFPFVLGSIAKKYDVIERLETAFIRIFNRGGQYQDNQRVNNKIQIVAVTIVVMCTIIRMLVPNQSLQSLYVFLIFILFPFFGQGERTYSILKFLGRHSLNIWLIHTWICYYLFENFVYGLKYPLLIFAFTLGVSIVISIIVERIYSLVFDRK